MNLELIDQHIYEGPSSKQPLEELPSIAPSFKRTIFDWIDSGHIVAITKDKFNNCLKYDFKITSGKRPRLGQLVILNVF